MVDSAHSHTSERPGYEARKNAKKVIEGNAVTMRRQTIRQNLPRTASVAGGARRQGEGVGRTTKKRARKTYSPVPQFSGPIAQTMAPY